MRRKISSAKILPVVTLVIMTIFCPQIGHSAATIAIINKDGPSEGFNDPTPFTPVGGNTATTLGAARLNAFQHAANVWGGLVNSAVVIIIDATFDPLYCDATSATLGSSYVPMWFASFPGALNKTLYVQALANALINNGDQDPNSADMVINFNSNLGQPGCLTGHFFYLGLDGQLQSPSQIDFVSVALHEITHGLGFTTTVNRATGEKAKIGGIEYDDVYMKSLEQHGGNPPLWPDMTNAQRKASAIDEPNLHWVGTDVQAGYPTIPLSAGTGPGTPLHVRMHAPNKIQSGSSVVHWSTALLPDPIMEPYHTTTNHIPDLEICLLSDIGWDITGNLYMKDNPADNGSEINSYPYPWESKDVWVSTSNAAFNGPEENPEYGQTNFVYVRVRNNSCYEGKGDLYVYWAKASTGLAWPKQWDNYEPTVPLFQGCPLNVIYGDHVNFSPQPVSVPAHSDKVYRLDWTTVPNPGDFICFPNNDAQHFCLLARIQTANTAPFGMTYPEIKDIGRNVLNNNNIVWKNITVVDLQKKSSSGFQSYIIHYLYETPGLVSLAFNTPLLEGVGSFLEYGEFYVHFSRELFERWQGEGGNGHGIEIVGDTTIRIIDPSADMSLIPMGADESDIFAVEFSISPENQCQEEKTFHCVVTQSTGDVLDGGLSYDILVGAPPCPVIKIEKTHGTLQGHFQEVSITTQGSLFEMGGFDFLLAYDASALTFTEAQPGELLDTCDWEYFTYRYGADGNCGDACPSGLLRLIALAETNNGPIHPSCFGPPDCDPHELAVMTFMVTNDRTFNGQYMPIEFFWGDCGDNSISSIDGGTLYIDRAIYDFEGNLIWDEEDNVQFPEDARIPFVGTPDDCLNPDPDKPTPERCPEFVNGGIDIIPDTAIDARGDINCNGFGNEIADAVMLTNYFIEGPTAFDNHYEGSVAASDVNADGLALSVADLVYLIRIITGDALPYAKPTPPLASATAGLLVNQSAASVAITAAADIGAACFVIDHTGYELGVPRLIDDASGMTMKYADADGRLRILIYSMDIGRSIPAGERLVLAIPIAGQGSLTLSEVQLSDYFGRPLSAEITSSPALPQTFGLHQNYPNPFNNATQITYELPRPTQVRIDVYNVVGQLVTTLLDAVEPAGVHSVSWNGADGAGNPVASGVYFYRLMAGDYTAEKKMVLMK